MFRLKIRDQINLDGRGLAVVVNTVVFIGRKIENAFCILTSETMIIIEALVD